MTQPVDATSLVTPEIVEAYERDGAVCIRGLFNTHQIAALAQGIEENLNNPSPRAKVASQPDDPGWFFEDFCNWQENAAYRKFIFESGIGDLVAKLMGSRQARLYHDHLLVKEPGTRQRTPWHQDQPYYNVEGHQNVSMWLPVDPVAREASLEFVAGSHKGPWLMPRTFMDNEAKWFPEGSLEDLPDIEANRDAYTILSWALEPGDAVFFNMLTLHGAAGVSGGQRRRAFSVRFLGDDMTHAPRPWTTSPPFPGLDQELAVGAPMDHPLFPLLTG
ncbi:phytanoyl-CoA dioxygenase family protein [Marinobacter sp. X15-166B]|uniref:phytanoyl-CoA dioxygenase family protein n=1 Tax=Marinobacter sp. X15-166B TaxID=1897620 RepID=UPI00085BBB93|nr:phytanoyl-CoA dioxygenase family protein [Marinobacter sp. X15-166B]OEY66962.1 phytanoyl-CoA dioxygenase [Marinobacter sp. X15-166B]